MKLIATIVATLALLFGGTVTLAPTMAAADEVAGACKPGEVCEQGEKSGCKSDGAAEAYAALVATQAAWIEREKARADRFERLADRRAATIKELRAKIRSIR